MKTNKPDHNSVVAKSNNLIGQMAKFGLSELRLIAFCLAHYDSRSPENRAFKARVDDLAGLFSMNESSAYRVVRQTMLSLGRKPLEFIEGRKNHYWNWFSGFTYDLGTGEFEFKITPEIQPYLLALGGNFTPYRLGDVYQFKAASTWKLYELLKKWVQAKSWDVDLDELRLLLGVAGKYLRWDAFKQHIDKCVKEINDLSDIKVEYTKTKRGRSVVGLSFSITAKREDEEEIIEAKSSQATLCEALKELGINGKTADQYAKEAEYHGKTETILNKLPKMAKRRKGESVQKYVLGAIKNELRQQNVLGGDAETQARYYREAVACHEKKEGECQRKTNSKAVCEICEKIF